MLPSELAREIEAIGLASVRACLDFSHAYLLTTKRGVSFLDETAMLPPSQSIYSCMIRSDCLPSGWRMVSVACTCRRDGSHSLT